MTKKYSLILLLVIAAVLFAYFIAGFAAGYSHLEVYFFNVGQGDSALIRDSNNFDILIDGGKTSAGPIVVANLRHQGVDDIDVMVVSHADSDHIGGLIDVLEMGDIPVESVLYNGYPGHTVTWSSFVTAVANEGITLTVAQFPQTFIWGDMTARILNPVAGLVNPDTNDASVVLLLEHGDNQFLFPGDIDSSIEAGILARGTPIAAEILKVAHHGSKNSSSQSFLAAVQPKEAIISVGKNSYGHPADETLARLLAVGAQIWRTDQMGTIQVTSNGITYNITRVFYSIFLPLAMGGYPTAQPSPTTPFPGETLNPNPSTVLP